LTCPGASPAAIFSFSFSPLFPNISQHIVQLNSAIKSVNLYMEDFAKSDHDMKAAQKLKQEVSNLEAQASQFMQLDISNCAGLDQEYLDKLADSLAAMITPDQYSAVSVMSDFENAAIVEAHKKKHAEVVENNQFELVFKDPKAQAANAADAPKAQATKAAGVAEFLEVSKLSRPHKIGGYGDPKSTLFKNNKAQAQRTKARKASTQAVRPTFFSQLVRVGATGLVIGLLIPVFFIVGLVGAAALGLLSLISPKTAQSIAQPAVNKFLDLTKDGINIQICSNCIKGSGGRNVAVILK
jgi:hypothetical protein